MKRVTWPSPIPRTRTGRDLLVVALVMLGTYGVARWLGLFEHISAFVAQHGSWRFDEFIPVCTAGAVALGWFALRRWREAKAEVQARGRAEQEAKAANQAKSDFLARMSYKIRTQLNGVIGTTELVLDTPLSAEQRELLEIARASSDTLVTVINDVLEFSEIEAGKLKLQRVGFGLRDCIGDTLEALAVPAHKKSLELAYVISDDVPDELIGDPTRLREVLVNLVGNAIKFTPAGGEVVVTMEAISSSDRETRVRCAVRDTGIGIPPEQHAHIFDVFEPADGSTTRTLGGTGLGLPISTQLVHLMGGEIGVESAVGQGSTFHFTASFGRQVGPRLAAPPPRPTALRGVEVLVVDDNLTNCRILETMLRGWEMEPTVVECGATALCAMQEAARSARPFRLAILDGRMPGFDGFAVAERIQHDPNLAGATILMLTSDRRMGDLARCRELGVAGYLVKPIRQSELLQAIWEILSATPVAPRTAPASDAQQRASLRPLQVLLAEDNFLNQAMMVRMLEKHGHRVTVAANGKEALARLAEAPFDVVLMDVEMPEMNGLEATAEIRRRERTADRPAAKRIPIVALTAYAMNDDAERCLDAGMDAYVSKPVDFGQLFQAIAALVPDAQVRDDAQGTPTGIVRSA